MSWLPVLPGHHFSINNIPFGIISTPTNTAQRPAIAIGEYVLDLHAFATSAKGFSHLPDFTQSDVFVSERTLNRFASLGRAAHRLVRGYIQEVLSIDTPYPEVLRDNPEARKACLLNTIEDEVYMHLPMDIGDYTDFYAGRNHAFNVGVLFRGRENALQPNYEHLPVGYHGRASSVVVSGTRVRRPQGQVIKSGEGEKKVPVFAESGKLDFELELAAFVGRGSDLGSCVGVDEAGGYLFGVVVMNDWSARDIQAWEYVPLGPFTSKSFATSISPWVVLMDALEPLRTRPLERGTKVPLLPYLQESNSESVYDIPLTISVKSNSPSSSSPLLSTNKKATAQSGTHKISQTSSSNLLFSFAQMIAHHTVTGCPLRTGDLLGTGTISGVDTQSMGSLLEMTANGTKKVPLGDSGEFRGFLEDGDIVVFTGGCEKAGVGFGECVGEILPAGK